MDKKIPFTKCDKTNFTYVKSKLENFGYKFEAIDPIQNAPYIIINRCDELGIVTNYALDNPAIHNDYNRYFEPNIDIFIHKCAELMGFDQSFIKSDLQSGMVVKLRNGEKYLVVGDMLIERNGFMRLCDYNDKLLRNTEPYVKGISEKYDIMVVYDKTDAWGGGFASGLHYGNIIWEREEIQEFTMEEIANKLGIPVNKFRIKG